MNTKVTIDGAGRVVIPKDLRDTLRLAAGDTLDLESDGEQVTLRPERAASPMRKERGIWVFRSGTKISAAETNSVLNAVREGRDKR